MWKTLVGILRHLAVLKYMQIMKKHRMFALKLFDVKVRACLYSVCVGVCMSVCLCMDVSTEMYLFICVFVRVCM